jgi:hypothetical protein
MTAVIFILSNLFTKHTNSRGYIKIALEAAHLNGPNYSWSIDVREA